MPETQHPDWPKELHPAASLSVEPHPPLSEAGRKALAYFGEAANEQLLGLRRKMGPKGSAHDVETLSERDLEYLCEAVVTLSYNKGEFWTPLHRYHLGSDQQCPFAQVSDLASIHLVRLLVLAGWLDHSRGFGGQAGQVIEAYRSETGSPTDLRELAALLEGVGLEADLVAREYLDGWRTDLRWGCDATWPYFVERLDMLAWALNGGRQSRRPDGAAVTRLDGTIALATKCTYPELDCIRNAFDALDCFPRVPPPLKELVWEMAIGVAKTFRKRAQRVWVKEPEAFERVAEELRSGRAVNRAIAAEWLGEWGIDRAIPVIRKALAKEQHDQARDAMMTALERLGVPLEGFLIPEEVAAAATRHLSKRGIPFALSWFPFDRLPAARWRHSGTTIPREVVVWWLVQAHRLKSPEPGGLLRRQIELIHPDDRGPLGLTALEAWIDFDTMPATHEDLHAVARRRRDEYAKALEFYEEPEVEVPPLEEFVSELLNEPGGSAIKFKGILAVPAACGGEASARKAASYVNEWYGWRAAQSKALVSMIAWIDHPTAIQFLTAAAKKFRTTGIRNEAYRCVKALAERRNWTVDELADRMVPDAGLDADGRIALDFGARTFTAELDPGFRLQARDGGGKLRRDLPKPGKKDDEKLATDARAFFSRAKKEVRSVVKEQTDRLLSAMCTVRTWRCDEWMRDIVAHPIVGRLCRGVVWRIDIDESVLTVRPGGTDVIFDVAGERVDLRPESRVSIAHDANTPPQLAVPWLGHLEDYGIEPLFPQFNRGLPDINGINPGALSIDDFEGYLIGGRALRNAAQKLGYRRGEAMDGPTFYDYRKTFPTLLLEVHIEFSGQDFDEPDCTVALERLRFRGVPDPTDDRPRHRVLSLAEVPRILLLESFRDLREIAEAGQGYDPGWRDKVHP